MIATLLPVSNTTSPLGWSIIHILIGNLMSRALSLGSVGMTVVIGNGPEKPLVVQNTLACADAVTDSKRHSVPNNSAAIPDVFIPFASQWIELLIVPLLATSFLGPILIVSHQNLGLLQIETLVSCSCQSSCRLGDESRVLIA